LATSIGKAARPNRDAFYLRLAILAVRREGKFKVTHFALVAVNQNKVFGTVLRTPADGALKSAIVVRAAIIITVDADGLFAGAAKNTDLGVVVGQGATG
jgi:hypothetical protein